MLLPKANFINFFYSKIIQGVERRPYKHTFDGRSDTHSQQADQTRKRENPKEVELELSSLLEERKKMGKKIKEGKDRNRLKAGEGFSLHTHSHRRRHTQTQTLGIARATLDYASVFHAYYPPLPTSSIRVYVCVCVCVYVNKYWAKRRELNNSRYG